MNFFIQAILYILPAYIANSTAVVFGGGEPIDFGKTFLGKRILGNGKTWNGLVIGTLLGTAVGFSIAFIFQNFLGTNFLLVSFLLSFGALLGDIVFSFIKRRIGMKRGQSLIVIDQIDFIIGALFLSSFVYIPTVEMIIFLLVFTPIIHLATNFIAYKIKLKKEPY